MIRKLGAFILLAGVYGFTWLIATVCGIVPRRQWKPNGRIMVTGTFHNPGWYLSHVVPLARSGVKEVILVIDEPQLPLEKVRFICPPKWLARLITRAGAKAIWMIITGLRYRPDLYMGYHIAPGACTALIAGKLLGRPVCYQMTAGPVEIIGGGIGASESMGAMLGRHSKVIESMALALLKRFDLVVVRGRKAEGFLVSHSIKGNKAIITGSIKSRRETHQVDRDIHLVFVGRLAPIKQIDQFIAIVKAVSCDIPSINAVIVGDGPLMDDMKVEVERLGLTGNIEFHGKTKEVASILSRSKVFVLTSESEGLSIAMAEAMASGVVPVVADVGELNDLVIDGINGYLIEPNNLNAYTENIILLLKEPALWTKHSHAAIEAATAHCEVDVVAEQWRQHLREIIAHKAGICTEEVLTCTTC
jgi:glycosyltransferase involved in cell wall biosynthesis